MLALVLVVAFGLWMLGQRLIAENMARAAQRDAARQAAAPAADPHVYQSPTGRFSVRFPSRPKRELVRSSEPGGLSHWEANVTLGEFLQGRGEQYLVTETARTRSLTNEKIDAALENLVNVTAGIDVGRGRILTSTDIAAPGQRGREVTYECQTAQGGRISGRYSVVITDREIISIEWVTAPGKSETSEVAQFFDSFKLEAQ